MSEPRTPLPEPRWPGARPAGPSPREWATSVGLFFATLVSAWFVYGWFWGGGSVLNDPALAWDGALYAGGLMAILLAHESGHYVVARRHGMDQTLPYFIPFPLAFGTLGAIIRLRALPRSRTALLEMGAAGPLAGFVVAVLVMALGMPGTVEQATPELVTPWPPPISEPDSGLFIDLLLALDGALGALIDAVRGLSALPGLGWIASAMDGAFPPAEPGMQVLMILANPPLMDLLGEVILGQPPGRYASIHPLALAGWAGCFLTAMNLLPIGQLDGGHITNALAPKLARRLSRAGLWVAVGAGVLWLGWTIWGLLLWKMGAWRSLPVPESEPPSRRARVIALAALACFGLCFMPVPFEQDTLRLTDLRLLTPDGREVSKAEVEGWIQDTLAPTGEGGGDENSDSESAIEGTRP